MRGDVDDCWPNARGGSLELTTQAIAQKSNMEENRLVVRCREKLTGKK